MKISREFAMANGNTFSIKPIRELIDRYIAQGNVVIDPFANSNKLATITNDLDPQYDTTYHMDALDFLKMLPDKSADVVLWDPPYSPRQVSECYKKFGMTVNMESTQNSYWSNQRKEIARIIKPGGYVLSFGWNSTGIGNKYGFEHVEILLVAHGCQHNDTICVVERKKHDLFS